MDKSTLDRLIAEHDQIRAGIAAIVEATGARQPVEHERLEALRWALSKTALQHLQNDERLVVVPLESHSDAEVRATAARFRESAKAITQAFLDHSAQWPREAIARDWATYGRRMRLLLSRLDAHNRDEERELYPLAVQVAAPASAAVKINWAGKAWAFRSSILAGEASAGAARR